MKSFLSRRGVSLGLIVLVLLLITLCQGAISYTVLLGNLRGRLPLEFMALASHIYPVRLVLAGVAVILWLLGRKRALFKLVVLLNAIAMVALLLHAYALANVLVGLSIRTVGELLVDVALIAVSNILIFSIWYWIVDPPGIDGAERQAERWAFLFPQRGAELPHYEGWTPGYLDYLFLAFTTSLAFSPTDTLPLNRTAKMLMLLQAAISVVTLTGIASSAINIFSGAAK